MFSRVILSSQCNKVHVGIRLTSGVPCKVPYSGVITAPVIVINSIFASVV